QGFRLLGQFAKFAGHRDFDVIDRRGHAAAFLGHAVYRLDQSHETCTGQIVTQKAVLREVMQIVVHMEDNGSHVAFDHALSGGTVAGSHQWCKFEVVFKCQRLDVLRVGGEFGVVRSHGCTFTVV